MESTLLSFNSSITQETLLLSTATTPAAPINTYDHKGAAIYIAVILVWYSTGLAMMLFLQVRPRSFQQQFLFDSSNSTTRDRVKKLTNNPFTGHRGIEADHTTKQILNELKDPERRQRLWKIYYASSDKENEPYPQYYQNITSDGATIDRIKRKLATIHRLNSINDQHVAPPSAPPTIAVTNSNRSSISPFDSAKFFSKRLSSFRRPTINPSTQNRGQFLRVQSTPDGPSTNNMVEMEPLTSRESSLELSTNTSLEKHETTSDRFIVEKVSYDRINE